MHKDSESSSWESPFLFMNNLPPPTTATHLLEYLESFQSGRVLRIELQEQTWRGTPEIVAHVKFVDASDAAKIINLGKQGRLVYGGRQIYAKLDRTTPDKIKNSKKNSASANPDMSYTRDDSLESPTEQVEFRSGSPMSSPTVASTITVDDDEAVVVVVDDLLGVIASHAGTAPPPHATEEPENTAGVLAENTETKDDDDSTPIMRQPEGDVEDPFADLIVF